MPKAQHRQHSWSEDPASGVRRSASFKHRRKRRRVYQPARAALASLAALLLAIAWLWSRPNEVGAGSSAQIVAKRLPLSAASPTSPPQLAAALPIKPMIELELSAWPREARLLLDGSPLPANPYRGRVPADDGLHLLRAVAVGLQTQELAITFDRDRSLTLTLSRPTSSHALARHASRKEQTELGAHALQVPPAPRQRTRVIYEEDLYR